MTDKVALSTNQRRALQALLEEKTVRDAAKKCKLSERTVWRYLSEDPFLRALQAEQSAIYTAASLRLSEGMEKALEGLHALMTGAQSEAVKRQAISDWLNMGWKLHEQLDIETRLSELEKRIL